jgi:hypothetical protein
MLGAGVKDALDGKEEFCEVGSGPLGDTEKKRFNH